MKPDWTKLAASLVVDGVGMATYFIPGLGESFDLAWAPVSAVLIYKMYGNMLFGIAGGLEEALPFTDLIPTATVCWVWETVIA